jgi:hypothetical protein
MVMRFMRMTSMTGGVLVILFLSVHACSSVMGAIGQHLRNVHISKATTFFVTF